MRRQRGYSLIEVLAAFAVLMLVLTFSLMAFVQRTRRMKQANELIRVYQALGNEAEVWRRVQFAALQDATAFSTDIEVLKPLGDPVTEVEVVDTNPWRKDVTLIVRWNEGKNVAKLELIRTDTGGTNLW